jgi:hypothetical protein
MEESILAQILATAKTMVESVVHPLRADVDVLKGTVDGINDTISPLWDKLWVNVTEIKDTVDAMERRVLEIVNSSYGHITRMTIPLLTACLDVLLMKSLLLPPGVNDSFIGAGSPPAPSATPASIGLGCCGG